MRAVSDWVGRGCEASGLFRLMEADVPCVYGFGGVGRLRRCDERWL